MMSVRDLYQANELSQNEIPILTFISNISIMFVNLFNKSSKSTQLDESNEDRSHKCSYKSDTLAKQELARFGILIEKTDSVFSGAALNLILDNIARPSDIMNILEREAHRLNYVQQNAECEFCMKKSNCYRICCKQKEQQMYLLNSALDKLKNISSQKLPLIAALKHKRSQKHPFCNRERSAAIESSIDTAEKMNTLKKIKRKLRNMKKYYPNLYYCDTSIIEEWAKNNFHFVKSEILEFDPEASSLFWV